MSEVFVSQEFSSSSIILLLPATISTRTTMFDTSPTKHIDNPAMTLTFCFFVTREIIPNISPIMLAVKPRGENIQVNKATIPNVNAAMSASSPRSIGLRLKRLLYITQIITSLGEIKFKRDCDS